MSETPIDYTAEMSPHDIAQLQLHVQEITRLLLPTGAKKLLLEFPPTPGLPTPSAKTQAQIIGSGGMPSFFLNTLPKSGSMYSVNLIGQGLGLTSMKLAGGYFPHDQLIASHLQHFNVGGLIAQEHVPASRINRVLLSQHLKKMTLHVRDPRQATLSWTHHLETLYSQEITASSMQLHDPPPPQNYCEMTLKNKIQWNLDHHLPHCVKWIEGWLDAEQDPSFTTQLLFTEFRELREAPKQYFEKLFEFFEIEIHNFEPRLPESDGRMDHYRKGEVDEWRAAFTPAQCEQATAAMPPRLLERFGWKR